MNDLVVRPSAAHNEEHRVQDEARHEERHSLVGVLPVGSLQLKVTEIPQDAGEDDVEGDEDELAGERVHPWVNKADVSCEWCVPIGLTGVRGATTSHMDCSICKDIVVGVSELDSIRVGVDDVRNVDEH